MLLLLLLMLLASSSDAEDSDCRDVFDDTCFTKVENEIVSIIAFIKANDESLSQEYFRHLCLYFDDSLECVSEDIGNDCSEDVRKEFLEFSVESLRTVSTDICKGQYQKLKDVFQDIECWNIYDFISCTERKANVDNIMHLLQHPVGGEECLNLTQDIDNCLEAAKNGSCREHKGVQSVKEMIGIYREEQCKNINPKDSDFTERITTTTETNEVKGEESTFAEINSSAKDVAEMTATSTEITTETYRVRSFSEAHVSSFRGLERESTSTNSTPSTSLDRAEESVTVWENVNISEVAEEGGISSTFDSNFSKVAGEKNSATENKSSISEVTETESIPSQASTVTREFTTTRSTFAPTIITSKFTETLSAITSEFSGTGNTSSLTFRTNSEVTENSGTFDQDRTISSEVIRNSGTFVHHSTIATEVKGGRGTLSQTSLVINDVTEDGTLTKADISQVIGKRSSVGSSSIEAVETESTTIVVKSEFAKAMHVKGGEDIGNGAASKKAATFLTFEFCFMMMPFLFLV